MGIRKEHSFISACRKNLNMFVNLVNLQNLTFLEVLFYNVIIQLVALPTILAISNVVTVTSHLLFLSLYIKRPFSSLTHVLFKPRIHLARDNGPIYLYPSLCVSSLFQHDQPTRILGIIYYLLKSFELVRFYNIIITIKVSLSLNNISALVSKNL